MSVSEAGMVGACAGNREVCLTRQQAQWEFFLLLRPAHSLAWLPQQDCTFSLVIYPTVVSSHCHVCVSSSCYPMCEPLEGSARLYISRDLTFNSVEFQFNSIQFNTYLMHASYVPLLGFWEFTKQTAILDLLNLLNLTGGYNRPFK